MMRKFYTLLLFLTISLAVSAQEETRKYRYGTFSIKWNPLDMFVYFPSFNLALEHRISDKFGLQLGGGPIIENNGLYSRTDMNMRGYKVKFQVRRYYPSESIRWRFFISPEVGYNNANYTEGKTYLVHQDNLLDYYQYIKTPRTYREVNINFNSGAQFSTHRFSLDFQVGIAGRFMKYNTVPVQPDNYELTDLNNVSFPFYRGHSNNIITPTAALFLGFILK